MVRFIIGIAFSFEMTSSGTAIIENKLVQKEGRNRSQYLLPPRS